MSIQNEMAQVFCFWILRIFIKSRVGQLPPESGIGQTGETVWSTEAEFILSKNFS